MVLCPTYWLCVDFIKRFDYFREEKAKTKPTENSSAPLCNYSMLHSLDKCHHKTIKSVGWVLLMTVNIAPGAAILVIHLCSRWGWSWPIKHPSSLCKNFFVTLYLHTTPNCWHWWQHVNAFLVHFIQERMGRRGEEMEHWNKLIKKISIHVYYSFSHACQMQIWKEEKEEDVEETVGEGYIEDLTYFWALQWYSKTRTEHSTEF